MRIRAAAFTLASLLSACGGSESGQPNTPDGRKCTFVAGGASSLTVSKDPTCVNCSISNEQAVADGDLGTYATVTVDSNSAFDGFTLRATAQEGVVFPTGSNPGFHWRDAGGVKCVAISTYLDGAVRENNFPNSCGSGGDFGYDAVGANETFDAVEIQIGGGSTLKIDEICADVF